MSLAVVLAFVIVPVVLIAVPVTVIFWLTLKRNKAGKSPPRGFEVRLNEAGREKEL